MSKKDFIGLGTISSTIIAILMWLWYANLPSFDKTETSFDDTASTFEEVIK